MYKIIEKNVLDLLQFHHTGLVVESIETSVKHYSALFGESNISDIIHIDSQKVNVCFVKVGPESFIELVEPIGEDSQVYKLLKKRMSYYHIGYKVTDIIMTVARLEELNYKPLNYFNSEAFEGKKCIFLFSPEAHLIELIEK